MSNPGRSLDPSLWPLGRALAGALALLTLAACGSTAPEPEPEPEPEPTTGAEVEPEPPPPAPSRLRLVHAAPDAATATLSLLAGDASEPQVLDLAFRSGSAYFEISPGAQPVVLRGLRSIETGEAPDLLRVEDVDLPEGSARTAIAHGVPAGEPPLALEIAPDRDAAPREGSAGARIFHALIGVPQVDVCIGGPSPRDPATPAWAALQPGTFGEVPAQDDRPASSYVDLPAGEVVVQLRAASATACAGRVLGVARPTLAEATNHTLVLVGRTTGRRRVDRELLVCSDGDAAACEATAIAAR